MPRPVELEGKTSKFIVLASTFIVIAGLYFGREVLIPISMAILLSFLLTPMVRRLEKWKLPRPAATLIVVGFGVAVLGSIGYVVYHQFVSVVEEFPNYRGELHAKLERLRSHGGVIKKAEQEFHNFTSATQPAKIGQHVRQTTGIGIPATSGEPDNNPKPMPVQIVPAAQSVLETTLATIGDYASKFLSPLATAFLVLILVIFMLLTREDLRDRMIRLIGHGQLNLTTQAIDDAGGRISRYLGSLAIVNSAYGTAVAGGLWAIGRIFGHGHGFPNVLVWGLLVGLFRFVPYVGIWIGAAVPLMLSFALFKGNGAFFSAVGLFIGLEAIVSQFIEPYWYGASTGMSALAVLVAAVVWTWLWGPIGLLLSTPLTVCLVVLGKYVPQLQFLDVLLGDEPVLPPHVRLYQRLIASDEEEATDLAHDTFKDHSLEQTYEEVLIPALLMAEQDHHRGRLEDEKLAFIHESMKNIVEEIGDAARQRREESAKAAQASAVAGGDKDVPKPRPSLPSNCAVNVLSLPAQGPADEIVVTMLTQLLELRGYCATAGSADQLASEMVEAIDTQKAQIVCVSATPPAAVAHARYLCKRIHGRYPDIHMIVGVWHTRHDPERIKRRIACENSVHLVTQLAQAQEEIDQLSRSPEFQNAVPETRISPSSPNV